MEGVPQTVPEFSVAGFVLAGGESRRMGRDKALLPFAGRTLLEHVAAEVLAATGSVTILGSPDRYGHFGFPVLPDLETGAGPLAGLVTALAQTSADWNLFVACDLPEVSSAFLRELLNATSGGQSLVPFVDGHWEPLCAVYHRSAGPVLARALSDKRLKLQHLMTEIDARPWPMEAPWFRNLNSPQDLPSEVAL